MSLRFAIPKLPSLYQVTVDVFKVERFSVFVFTTFPYIASALFLTVMTLITSREGRMAQVT
jgi:hypothetical protein